MGGVKATAGEETIDIGAVIAGSGLPPSTLHLWERRGLISPVERRGLRRQYPPGVFDALAAIVVLQRAGFTLDEIASILNPVDGPGQRRLIRTKLNDLEVRRRELDAAIDGLRRALDCDHVAPLDCPEFSGHLDEVLPVGRSERKGRR